MRYVVAFDAGTAYASARHLVPKTGDHVPLCDAELPHRTTRYASDEEPEANCLDCLRAHALDLAEVLLDPESFEHAKRVAAAFEGEPEEIVAILHDMIEEVRGVTARRLRAEHFPAEIVEAVALMSWDKNIDTRKSYLLKITLGSGLAGRYARAVKHVDAVQNRQRCEEDGDVSRAVYYDETVRMLDEAMRQRGEPAVGS